MGEHRYRRYIANFGIIALLMTVSLVLVRCGGSSPAAPGVGTANVTMSDPPSGTTFDHVYVTVDGVSASTSGTSDSGWQTLADNLSSTSGSITAVQLDLLNLPQDGKCLLAQMGSTHSLPVGDYQQIRLQLVPNGATGVNLLPIGGTNTTPTNMCSGTDWNCVVPKGATTPTTLQLSSQAQTGLKIPPGQVLGGPIHVADGQSVDINLDFNAYRSIVQQGPGQYRLNPVLVAYQVDQNLTGISGQVVEGQVVTNSLSVTSTAIAGANVALEMANDNPMDGSSNVDLLGNYMRQTDSNGQFDFCPLPAGPFDIVANAGGTTTYNATIVTGVPNGTQVTVPLIAETGGPATLTGDLTATPASSTATSITASVYALQAATSSLEFAVPQFATSNPAPPSSMITLTCSAGTCTTAPSNSYSLIIPASNPLVGAFSSGSISWTLPGTAAPAYKVEGTCTTATGTTGQFSTSQTVTADTTTTVTPAVPNLTGCQ